MLRVIKSDSEAAAVGCVMHITVTWITPRHSPLTFNGAQPHRMGTGPMNNQDLTMDELDSVAGGAPSLQHEDNHAGSSGSSLLSSIIKKRDELQMSIIRKM
jgi:hypothetical protein